MIALVAFVFWVAWTSPTFKQCVQAANQNYVQNSFQEHIGTLYVLLIGDRLCVGDFIHTNGDSIIALFTIILGSSTWALWRATRDLVAEAKATGVAQVSAAEQSATATQIAARAASASVELAGDTAKKQLRAYVCVKSADVNANSNGTKIDITLKLTNAGQTPAHEVSVWMNTNIWSLPLTEDAFPPSDAKNSIPSRGLVGPHTDIEVSTTIITGIDRVVGIITKATKETFVCWGEAKYADIYDTPRYLRFKATLVREPSGLWSWKPTYDNNKGD